MIWGEVSLRSGRKLYLGSFYRTPSGNPETQLDGLAASLRDLNKITRTRRDAIITLGGDFNFGDIRWEDCTVPPGSTGRMHCQRFIDILHDNHLAQMQREPTRGAHLLDLFITNQPSLVKSMSTVPSMSDHDGAIVADSDVTPTHNK